MATIPLSEAKPLCTAAEFKLASDASRPTLGSLSQKALRARIDRARKLRDKWDDLATRQRRQSQQSQGSRGTSDAKRSRKKSQLFTQVLMRFEKQLKKVEAAGEPAPNGTLARKKATKSKRTIAHRQKRSQVREELSMQQAELNPPPDSRKKKAAKKKASKPTPAAAAAPKKPKKKTVAKSAAQPTVEPAALTATKKRSSMPIPAAVTGLVQFNRKQQRTAQTAAKQARLKQSGIETHFRGHVSARGKRSQGRRDSRG